MSKSIRFLAAALVIAMVFCLGACGGKTEPKVDAAAQQGGDSAAPITISLLDQFVAGEGMTNVVRGRLDAFLAAHPNVKIEQESLSTSDLATKIQTLAAANELPDVFLLKGQMAKSFVANHYVMDVTEFLKQDEQWYNGFRDGVFSNFEFNGSIYAIPHQVTNTCVFYNEELFQQAGIDSFPETWQELIDACKKLADAGIVPITLGNSGLWPAESVIMSTLGNRCTGTEWYEKLRNNEGVKFTDEQFVKALQSLYDLAAAGAFNTDVNSIDGDAQRAAFMNGEAAMMFDGSWAVASLDSNMDADRRAHVKLAAMPAVEGGDGEAQVITGGAGWAFAVNANLDPAKLEAVRDLLKTVVSTEFADENLTYGTVTAYNVSEKAAPAANAVIGKLYVDFIEGRKFIPVYDHQLSSGLMDVMQSGLQEILNNTKTAEVLAQELQTQYEMENG